MQLTHRLIVTGLPIAAIAAGPAAAQSLDLSIAIPRLSVAEYHRPYVAVWLEQAGQPAKTLSIWYDVGKKDQEGKKWLTDVRQWWRAAGRSMNLPANGVSGATRAPGTAKASYAPKLAPGNYVLKVEAAREVGGREVVSLPFSWPPKGPVTASGKSELGAVSLAFRR